MADLSVKVCGVEFNNPLIAASGTFGFGMEYSELYPLEKLGGISCIRTSNAGDSRNRYQGQDGRHLRFRQRGLGCRYKGHRVGR